jgi:hypothetical protein
MSRLKIESKGMFISALFYLVAAAANIIVLGMFEARLFHVGLVAILSLLAAFGLIRLNRWSLWLVVGLFFIVTTYGAIMLNMAIGSYAGGFDILAIIAWVAYLILTWVATMYVAAKRKNLR